MMIMVIIIIINVTITTITITSSVAITITITVSITIISCFTITTIVRHRRGDLPEPLAQHQDRGAPRKRRQ